MDNVPLTAETMDSDGAVKLLAAIFEGIRENYINGKLLLLQVYGRDMTENEFNKMSHEGSISENIRKYYRARRSVINDAFGITAAVCPEDIFDVWDRYVNERLSKSERRRVEYSVQARKQPILREKEYASSGKRPITY